MGEVVYQKLEEELLGVLGATELGAWIEKIEER